MDREIRPENGYGTMVHTTSDQNTDVCFQSVWSCLKVLLLNFWKEESSRSVGGRGSVLPVVLGWPFEIKGFSGLGSQELQEDTHQQRGCVRTEKQECNRCPLA